MPVNDDYARINWTGADYGTTIKANLSDDREDVIKLPQTLTKWGILFYLTSRDYQIDQIQSIYIE